MNPDAIDWSALRRLRDIFLKPGATARDYWHEEQNLESYNRTFAQRIGWKWDYVLEELKFREWAPPVGLVLDWGCGSGIAGRAFVDHFGSSCLQGLALWDRSALAMDYAMRLAVAKYPGLPVSAGLPPAPAVALVSHVLGELGGGQVEALVEWLQVATSVIWVEPGTYEASRALIAIREQLRGFFNMVAPCTHQAPCGLLAAGNEPHWCHHFAKPPPAVFTDPHWGRFARDLGIDLRSLPVSFLVLDRRLPPELPARAVRVLGLPRVYKPHALLLGCDASGVRERRLQRRHLPAEHQRLQKGDCPPVQVWELAGDEIQSCQSMTPRGFEG